MSSKRGYLSIAELEEYADITITDTSEAEDQISMAEEIIDEYVGPQKRFLSYEVRGLLASGGTTSVTLETEHQYNMQKNYLRGCFIEIMGGTGEGQRRKIAGQTYEGVVTVETAFSPALDTSSYYRIWQIGKFPRPIDTSFDGEHVPQQYYKSIPEKVRRAVAAQVEFMINMGTAFFSSDKIDYQSESIGDYSYSKGGSGNSNASGTARLIAPKAQELLRGITNRTGRILC